MDEFAMGSSNENSSIKPASNPWDLEECQEEAVGDRLLAVAASEIPVALGTDWWKY